jgi:hypothetical protein
MSVQAFSFVTSVVPKPGMVYARMLDRGRPRRSMALAQTMRAWVESRPPDTPITTFSMPVARSRCMRPWTWMLYAS